MGAKETLQKIADRKALEIQSLQIQLGEARAYHHAIQDAIKALPREQSELGEDYSLREGTAIAEARQILASAGRPLHILEILKRMGRQTDKPNRVSLSGSLSAYVRKNQVFRKTGPNTFSLISRVEGEKNALTTPSEEFPLGFGNVLDPTAQPSEISPFQTGTPFAPFSEQSDSRSLDSPGSTAQPKTEAIRESVATALESAGHASAAEMLRTGMWSIDGDRFRIEVPGMGRKMLSLTVNAAAERTIRQALGQAGVSTQFSVVPSRDFLSPDTRTP